MSLPLLPRSLTALAAVAALAAGAAGCGSSDASSSGGDAGADPARSLPAGAPVYVEAQVRPEGDLKANVDAVARKILSTDDPGQKVIALLDEALKDKGTDFKTDIEPWLGKRAGLAVTALRDGGKRPDLAAAIASKDDDKARAFVDAQQKATSKPAEYRGVSYLLDAQKDLAIAVVDHQVVLGTERGFKSAIDASKGDALADAKVFKEARDTVGTDGLGFVYLDPSRIFDLVLGGASSTTGAQAQAFKGLLTGTGVRSVAARLDVAADALRVDAAVIGYKSPKGSGGGGPGAAAAVPADAWLSVGVGDVGGVVRRSLSQLGQGGATGGLDPAVLLQQLKGSLGVDVEKDLLSWMGDAALFVRGASPDAADGALVVRSKDPAASRRAIPALRRLLTTFGVKTGTLQGGGTGAEGFSVQLGQAPARIQVAAKDDTFVVAFGADALRDALAAGRDTLGDTAPFKEAAGLLDGAPPSLFLDTPKLVTFVSAIAGSDPGFAKARPTLEAFGPAAAGLSGDGDVTRVKIAVKVK